MYNVRHYFLLSFFLLSCEREETGLYQIQGQVYYDSKLISEVKVSIDDLANLSTETNEDGTFVINNVKPGEYNLTISKTINKGSASSVTEKSYRVQVTGNVELDNLQLTDAVFLSSASEVTESSISLKWSQTDDVDFREYKLYRHSTSGLDETTGLLIHVSTSSSDTLFVDRNLFPNTSYFYRVYVMDNHGLIGGSNIVSAKTNQKELLIDGSFESLTSLNESQANWRFYGCPNNEWRLNSEDAFRGSKSIEIRTITEGNCGLYFESKNLIATGDVRSGQKLRLTFQYKGLTSDMTLGLYGMFGSQNFYGIIGSDTEWRTYSHDIILPQESNSSTYQFVITIDPAFVSGTTLLVDDMSLRAID